MNDGILCRGTQHKHTIDLKKVVPVVSLIVSINIIRSTHRLGKRRKRKKRQRRTTVVSLFIIYYREELLLYAVFLDVIFITVL